MTELHDLDEVIAEFGIDMTGSDLESYWAAELGESVDIVPVGWAESPEEYRLLIGGTDVVSYRHLEEIENWLERYMMVQGEEHVG